MDRRQLIELVTHARKAADECERLRVTEILAIRALRAAGESTQLLEAALIAREAEYDRHVAEMERLLDELDGLPAIEMKV
ncbi:hypothetical protein [Taklimakanibacter deserti]|uniref:hypothetical protein n=1 Tax=Taklimakanibacter deserti TaxID=2267839 RepID=UPI000E653E32